MFFCSFNQLLSCCVTLWGNSAQMIHINDYWIRETFLLSRNVVTSTVCGQSQARVLSLEHLIPMTQTGLTQPSIHGAPMFPLAAPIPGGWGRLHPAFCQSWNLDRTFPVGAKQSIQKPPTCTGPSFGYDHIRCVSWKNSGLNDWGCFALWHFLLWWCWDTELVVTAFSAGNPEELSVAAIMLFWLVWNFTPIGA